MTDYNSFSTEHASPSILFFDIDGTILDESTGLISENTRLAIKQAQKNGHLAFINSGRTICCIDKVIKDIGFDGYICGCGTYIEYKGQVLLSTSIDDNLSHAIIKDIQSYKLDAVLEGRDSIYFGKEIQFIEWKRQFEKQKFIQNISVKHWDEQELSFDKFCVWAGNKDSDYNGFYNKYKTLFHFIDRESFYEVVPIEYSKATGIQFLMDYLSIPHENTYGLGDSNNDLPMLEYVNTSIAMGNSTPSLRESVSFITKDVDKNGIEYALKHFQLI